MAAQNNNRKIEGEKEKEAKEEEEEEKEEGYIRIVPVKEITNLTYLRTSPS